MASSTTSDQGAPRRIVVGFYFDPICPWTWVTARWLLEVQKVRSVDVVWQVMSLSVLHEGQEPPAEYEETLRLGWGTGRALAAASEIAGNDAVLALLNELGHRIHNEGQLHTAEMIAAAVSAADLPPEVAAAAIDPAWDEALRASHYEAMALVGDDVGSPVMRFGDTGFFGPVVSPAPAGEDAGRLFDGLHLCATVPGFFELKRTRDVEPIFD